MSYSKLYQHCQGLTPKIGRNVIRDKVLELTGVSRVSEQWDSLDPAVCRGYSLHGINAAHPIHEHHGDHLIVIAREQSYCWKRFIFVKELMHLFDTNDEKTADKESFERVLIEFGSGSPDRSRQMSAEIKAVWMALGLFCPEQHRLQLERDLIAQKMDSYDVANHLKIPQDHIPRLFSKDYPRIIQKLRAE